jgi:predicted Zn-dependent protease
MIRRRKISLAHRVAHRVAHRAFRVAACASLVVAISGIAGCATNPATGGHNVVLTSTKGEQESARRIHMQVIQVYGLYEDQAVQDYVQKVGAKLAANTPLASWNFKFFVLDDDDLNAFTTGGGYVYVHRGLLPYLNSEAELAAVLAHEIGHNTARHPARSQTRGVLASVLATGAAIMTGSPAVAEMANVGAEAWINGYGRENEMEADRLGLEYATKTGYRPEAMGNVFKVFKAQERFELDRAKEEGREPQIYHGVFSDHPAPDEREVQAAKGVANITTDPPGGWIDNRDAYLKVVDGLPFGSSREQGIVRDNRFYHAGMGITMAFPRGWTVENQRDRLLVHTRSKDAIMQVTLEKRPDKKSPREFLLEKLKGASFARGEELTVNDMQGYALVTRSGNPLDAGEGPVRWVVLYRDKNAFLFGGASRSAVSGAPIDDGVFMSSIQTLRAIKPSEFPLAQPYRLKVIQATDKTRLEPYVKDVPVEKYKKEELELLNGLYPNHEPKPGDYIKIVE